MAGREGTTSQQLPQQPSIQRFIHPLGSSLHKLTSRILDEITSLSSFLPPSALAVQSAYGYQKFRFSWWICGECPVLNSKRTWMWFHGLLFYQGLRGEVAGRANPDHDGNGLCHWSDDTFDWSPSPSSLPGRVVTTSQGPWKGRALGRDSWDFHQHSRGEGKSTSNYLSHLSFYETKALMNNS